MRELVAVLNDIKKYANLIRTVYTSIVGHWLFRNESILDSTVFQNHNLDKKQYKQIRIHIYCCCFWHQFTHTHTHIHTPHSRFLSGFSQLLLLLLLLVFYFANSNFLTKLFSLFHRKKNSSSVLFARLVGLYLAISHTQLIIFHTKNH